jgi:hypothetical protein
MKLGLQNYAVIVPTENSCIRFNNNKGVTFHKIEQFYTKWLSGRPNITSKVSNHSHIQKLRQRQ